MNNKRYFLFLIFIFLISGCVSKSKYEELKKENERLKAQIEELKFGPQKMFNEAKALLEEKKLDESLKKMNLLFQKHPDKKVDSKYKKLYSSIKSKIKQRDKRLEIKKKNLKRRLNKYINVKYDEMQQVTWYETKRNTYKKINDYQRFMVEPYIGKNDNGSKFLRIRTRYIDERSDYHDTKWIFYQKVQLLGDNGTNIYIITEYPEKKSDNDSYGLTEWSDNLLNADLFLKLAESKIIKAKFYGKYSYEFKLNRNQLNAIKEIAEKYKNL